MNATMDSGPLHTAPNSPTSPPGSLKWVWSSPSAKNMLDTFSRQIRVLCVRAMRADDVPGFWRLSQECIDEFAHKLVAMTQISSSCGDVATATPDDPVDFFSERAAEYGGDEWEDAVRDSWASAIRASALLKRYEHEAPVEVVVRASCHLIAWFWTFACFAALAQETVHATGDVRTTIRETMSSTAQTAFVALRGWQLTAQADEQEKIVAVVELTGDDVDLEHDAALQPVRA